MEYTITDEQLQLIEDSDGVEVLRSGHKYPYKLVMRNDGTYERIYESEEMIKEGEEIQVHFYGANDGWYTKEDQSFVLKPINKIL